MMSPSEICPPWVTAFAGDLKKVLRMRLGVREEEGLKVYFTGHSSLETGVNLEASLMENASAVRRLHRGHVACLCRRRRLDDARAQRLPCGPWARPGASSPSNIRRSIPTTNIRPMLRELKRMAFWQKHPEREIPGHDGDRLRHLHADAARSRRADPAAAEEDAGGAEASRRAPVATAPPSGTAHRTGHDECRVIRPHGLSSRRSPTISTRSANKFAATSSSTASR